MSAPVVTYGSLFAQHAAMLAASGVTPEQAHARGYRSVDTKARLDHVGIAKSGHNVPGLMVPQLRADGSCWGYQYRPDKPRLRDGKPVKYETPVGQRNGIDVPPGVAEHLSDPFVPLWVTEGVKKADAAAVAGLACIALPGVWSWRGKNDRGGKVAVADWHDVALNERRVILAFDGDVARKQSVRRALDELAEYLRSKGANVEFCHLPDADDKVGIDDYLMAGHDMADLLKLVHPDPPPVSEVEPVEPVEPVVPVPPDTPQETGSVLDDVHLWLSRFVKTMTPGDLDILTLWAAHTHVAEQTYTSPRLVLDSPVPGSGKTTTLDHLQRLCVRPVQAASLSSPALLVRLLDNGIRTILIDEADRTLDPKKEGVGELIAILNSGYRRGASRPVLTPTKDGWQVSEMATYAPVAMAGNNPNLPEDTRQRCIRVLLLPDVSGRIEESDWEVIEEPARELGARLARWADQVRDQVRTRPDMPEGITGRDRERWGPLKRLALAAGSDWPARVDVLALYDKEQTEMDREDGMIRERPALVLLRHMFDLWPEGEAFIPTADIARDLAYAHPDEWGDGSPFGKPLTVQRLGRMLTTSYKVNTTRLTNTGPRGYSRASLLPIWRSFGIAGSDANMDNPYTPLGYGAEPVAEPVSDTPSRETGETGSTGSTGSVEPPESSEPPEPVKVLDPCPLHGAEHRPDVCVTCEGLVA